MSIDRSFFQLLRLASPGLPIGGYSYSQGLESALALGLVTDADSAEAWLRGVLEGPMAHFDAAVVAECVSAGARGELTALAGLGERYLATRETEAARRETLQMGYSLRTLLSTLPEGERAQWPEARGDLAFPVAWAVAGRSFGLDRMSIVGAYLYGWLENQMLVLMKAMPLGHTAAQALTSALLPALERATATALEISIEDWSGCAPMLGIAAMRHETQYTRLFRS